MAVLKEQEAGSTSDTTSDGQPDDEYDEANLGPKSNVSLLDQHSDLKRKAEGQFIFSPFVHVDTE